MKRTIAFILFALLTNSTHAQNSLPIIVQLKYSPWGGINADEDEFESGSSNDYERYEMSFDHSYSGRILLGPVYLSHQRSNATIEGASDAEVSTIAIGVAGINYDVYESQHGTYLMGGVGIGRGTFTFDNSNAKKEQEVMFEANAEVGMRIAEHLLMGAGVDFQHFGEFGESKASSWTFYISTGVVF